MQRDLSVGCQSDTAEHYSWSSLTPRIPSISWEILTGVLLQCFQLFFCGNSPQSDQKSSEHGVVGVEEWQKRITKRQQSSFRREKWYLQNILAPISVTLFCIICDDHLPDRAATFPSLIAHLTSQLSLIRVLSDQATGAVNYGASHLAKTRSWLPQTTKSEGRKWGNEIFFSQGKKGLLLRKETQQ